MYVQRLGITVAALITIATACAPKGEEPGDQGPDNAKTCKHVVEVAGKTVEDAEVLGKIQADCETSLIEVGKQHATLSDCMQKAGSVEEIRACEQPMQSYASVLAAVVPEGAAVCEHVLEIMKIELGDTANEMLDGEKEKFMEKCVKDLEKEKEKLGKEKFDETAKCVMAAKTVEELMKCENDE